MKKCLRQLVIDTATKYLYVSLIFDGEVVSLVYESGMNNHSETLMPVIENMFKKHDIKVSDIDEILLGVGPGSYTGLRIGIVIGKMFAWNNNIKVRTFSSLALIASGAISDGELISYIDARRGNAFCGLYSLCDGRLVLKESDKLRVFSEFTLKFENALVIDGSNCPNINILLQSDLLENVEDIHLLSPNYLRITEAERNK